MPVSALPDLNVLPAEALRALILAQHEQLLSREREIEHLKLLLCKLHRMQFGAQVGEAGATDRAVGVAAGRTGIESQRESKPTRAVVGGSSKCDHSETGAPRSPRSSPPANVPPRAERNRVSAMPGRVAKAGRGCVGDAGVRARRFVVIRHVRTKLSCTKCDCIVQAEAPSRPIERGMAGRGLLAHVLVSKYADHQPLYRQSEIYARHGVELERSTMASWVGGCSRLLEPLVEALRGYITAAVKLHADDTPVPVLAPGQGKTKTGRLWTYVRDDRPAGDNAAPAVWFAYSPDRKGKHPAQHLKTFRGTLQADAYAGFNQLYENNCIEHVACWAHVRRHFYDLEQAHSSPVARGGIAADRRAVWNRRTDSRSTAGRTASRPPGTGEATAGFSAAMAGGDLVEALAKVGNDDGHPLRSVPLGRADTLYRRWTRRDRQQRRRAVLTRCGPGAEELSVCRIGCWRGAGGDDLQLDWFGETQRSRSRSLSAPGADTYRRPSHQPHRGVTALEHHLHSSGSVHLTASWTLSNTVHCVRLPIRS
jgi:transposase